MFFRNEYWFLSNMFPCEMRVNGLVFTCAESCYQSFKTTDPELRKKFQGLNGFEAKKLGRKIPLRKDWFSIRLEVMECVVKVKFKQHPELFRKLMAIKEPIVEDNTWKDTFWGKYNGVGNNHLGKILMNIRDEIKSSNILHHPNGVYDQNHNCIEFEGKTASDWCKHYNTSPENWRHIYPILVSTSPTDDLRNIGIISVLGNLEDGEDPTDVY